jgi:dihydropteroate synthase
MTARWIPLDENDAAALARLGWAVPAEPEWALLGLEAGAATVPGAVALRLDVIPHLVWWAGPAERLRRWAKANGLAPVVRWETTWRTGYGPVLCGARTALVGVVNVTPDSFSDGGRYLDPDRAVRHARRLARAGADWIDVGAESTRPGHTPVAPDEEWRRLEPVLRQWANRPPARLMVDTRHPETASAALRMGVGALNDVSALADPAWLDVLRESEAGYVLMFNRDEPWPEGDADWGEVLAGLYERLARLAGLPGGLERVVVDPGLGFAWTGRDNLRALARVGLLRLFDRPVLVGPSRKRFVGAVTGRAVGRRDVGSAVAGALAAARGADLLRLHNVGAGRDAARVADAVARYA